jgi:hypothetical protein
LGQDSGFELFIVEAWTTDYSIVQLNNLNVVSHARASSSIVYLTPSLKETRITPSSPGGAPEDLAKAGMRARN